MRIAAGSLRFEHLSEPLGIGVAEPRLSWRVEGTIPRWKQTAYEIEGRDLDGDDPWSSGKVDSSESVLLPWPGPPLASRQCVAVRIRAWGEDPEPTPWSERAIVEAGLLETQEWIAGFVSPSSSAMAGDGGGHHLRREFDLRPGIVRARLYATALGVYELELNGARVGDQLLAPGWTSYDHRLRYQAFDVTGLLREGRNAIGGTVADGWYRGRIGFPGQSGENLWGDRTALLAQLEVVYADGSNEVIGTDASWRTSPGPILAASIYDGETYDARLEMPGWSSPGWDDCHWQNVSTVERDLATLVAPTGPPVRRLEERAPISQMVAPSGKTILDFGQNFAGYVRIQVRGPAGTEVTLRFAEVLQDGELCTWPLRGAKVTDRYILRGGGPETWEPRFTYHGFRYVEVDGWPGEIPAGAVTAVVCHSDMERTGWFECSDERLNRLHENVVWSMRSNFFDIPTDCPQRDERLGWTGDIAVFAPTACFLYDVSGFLSSWLGDVAADQDEHGVVPIVVPDALSRQRDGERVPFRGAQAIWGDATVLVPWTLYQRYGDKEILVAQYESMKAWVEALAQITGEARRWQHGFQLADWLDPAAPPERPAQAMTDPHLVATAYFAHVAGRLGQIAGLLEHQADAARYATLSNEVRDAFRREYVTAGGRLVSDSQTAYALAIVFGLLEDEERAHAGERLETLVRRNGYRVGTGFAGTPLILDALCAVGAEDAAFRMLTCEECPSWLYPLTMGATTVWERWDSLRPDGSVNSGQMTSFNHYALGAVADWMHRRIGGIAPLEPGYRRFEVRPLIGGGITHASARVRTPYGLASVDWQLEGGVFNLDVSVPPNTEAVVIPPAGGDAITVAAGTHHWSLPARR